MAQSAIRIRPATPADASAVARTHVDSWRTTYQGLVSEKAFAKRTYQERETVWTRVLADPTQFVFVAETEGQIVGFSNGGRIRGAVPGYSGELYSMYILKEYQRIGLGRALTRSIAEKLAEAGLTSMLIWVLRDNPSRRFYEAIGGTLVGSRPIDLEGRILEEVSYGWPDLRVLLNG